MATKTEAAIEESDGQGQGAEDDAAMEMELTVAMQSKLTLGGVNPMGRAQPPKSSSTADAKKSAIHQVQHHPIEHRSQPLGPQQQQQRRSQLQQMSQSTVPVTYQPVPEIVSDMNEELINFIRFTEDFAADSGNRNDNLHLQHNVPLDIDLTSENQPFDTIGNPLQLIHNSDQSSYNTSANCPNSVTLPMTSDHYQTFPHTNQQCQPLYDHRGSSTYIHFQPLGTSVGTFQLAHPHNFRQPLTTTTSTVAMAAPLPAMHPEFSKTRKPRKSEDLSEGPPAAESIRKKLFDKLKAKEQKPATDSNPQGNNEMIQRIDDRVKNDPSSRNSHNETLLHEFAKVNDDISVKPYIERFRIEDKLPAMINAVSTRGETVLSLFVGHKNAEMAYYLIQKGATPDVYFFQKKNCVETLLTRVCKELIHTGDERDLHLLRKLLEATKRFCNRECFLKWIQVSDGEMRKTPISILKSKLDAKGRMDQVKLAVIQQAYEELKNNLCEQ